MLTNYNGYGLIDVILSIFTLGSSLCISASGLLLSSPSLYIPANDAAKDGCITSSAKNGSMPVKLENWINENADGKTWKKVDEKIDGGGWGKDGGRCGGRPDQIITWGGPIVTFRWDGAEDVDIKNFSVREIDYPQLVTK